MSLGSGFVGMAQVDIPALLQCPELDAHGAEDVAAGAADDAIGGQLFALLALLQLPQRRLEFAPRSAELCAHARSANNLKRKDKRIDEASSQAKRTKSHMDLVARAFPQVAALAGVSKSAHIGRKKTPYC